VVIRRQLKRRYVLAFFEKLPPCLVGIEACRTPMQSKIKADGKALSRACGARLAGLPDAWRSGWCTRGQAERELPTRRSLEGSDRASKAH